jgi:hypothetical protein
MIMKTGSAALTASIAIVALMTASPGYTQGQGNDKGAGGGKSNSVKIDRNGPSGGNRAAPDRRDAERNMPVIGRKDKDRDDRGAGNSAKGNQGQGSDVRGAEARNLGNIDRIAGDNGYEIREIRETFGSRPRLIDGCPPGLAKKRNGCLPPGQAKDRYRSFEPSFFGLNGAESGRYFYQDGYLLRYGNDGLAGFLPLLGGALGIGNIWPASYQSAPLPNYYSGYFKLGDRSDYRYSDNVIYRVNPENAAITSIAGLLTGNEFEIGRPMPRGYDVYNVPFDQRDQYADSAQARYRYADGYVYKIDPTTALITSAIALVL